MATHARPVDAGGGTTPPTPRTDATAAGSADHPGMVLVLMIGIFLSVLDFFVVSVAVPSIQRDLSATSATVQLTIAAYALGYAGLLIVGGRLGDIFGRRRMFSAGILLFTVASAVCGVAPNAGSLIAGRFAQGLAAAIMTPQVLSIVSATLTGASRARAFTAYGFTMGVAALFGQLIGGVLIWADPMGLGWRSVFLINVPIGVAALVLVPRRVPESRATGRPVLDLPGMILISLAMGAMVLPLIEGRERGWPLWAWLCLAAALMLFAAFMVRERAVAGRRAAPLVHPGLFHDRAFSAGLLTQLLFYFGQASFFLVFAVYVQNGRGFSALQAGVLFIAIGGGYMATSLIAQRVAMRLGRQVIALGALLRTTAAVLMIAALAGPAGEGSIWWLVPALVIDGAGQGLAVAPLASTVLSRIDPQHAGAASGVLSTGIWAGNAFGVAIIGIIFYGTLSRVGGDPFRDAFSASLVFIAVVGVLVATLVQFLPRAPQSAR